ncbi:restriction endonuclease subunit S [Neisseria sp. P0001.S009]|uniref:restriction endonuclease subunit S n=1 Tax=unclassified Neisseria TaxID=2623750 RepID=UPI001CB66CCF|nr:restriction endonuclease subunit S [Neisseria sp.]MBF1301724.1 restriction endonuclease subunit S [Neisseria sp.]
MNKQQEPRLRFKGFSGAWEEKKIGEILSEVRRSIYLEDSEKYQLVTVKRRNEGVVSRGYLLGKDILVKNYSQLKTNDYLISKRQIIHGANGIVPSELDNAIVSNEYLVVVSNNDVRTEFLTLVSRTPSMYRKFLLSSYGVDIEKMVFNVEDWKSREITLPSLPEQTHLGLFFRRLDSQIAESRAVLEKSRQLKKAMLAKMFPANGEKIPKIRFKGFEGEWKTRSLRDVLEIERKGKAQYQKLQAGNVPYLDAEFLNGGVKILTDAVSDVDVNDILIIWDGSNAGKVYTGFNGVLGSTLKSYRTNADCSSMFLYQELVRNAEVIFSQYRTPNIPHVIKDFSDEYNFLMPSYTEQTAIGNFFRQLDETIALQTAEVEKLNQLKKGLLAAMLV